MDMMESWKLLVCLSVAISVILLIEINMLPDRDSIARINHLPHQDNNNNTRLVIIGSMSLIGSNLAYYADTYTPRYHAIIPLEDITNVTPHRIKWYRWTSLHKAGLPVGFVDLTARDNQMGDLSNSDVVLVLTPLFEEEWLLNSTASAVHSQYIIIYKVLNAALRSSNAKVTIVMPSMSDVIMKSWVNAFKLLVKTYERYIDVVTITMNNGIYGPWMDKSVQSSSCWYIDDVVHKILHTSGRSEYCNEWLMEECPHDSYKDLLCSVTSYGKGLAETKSWMASYRNTTGINVIAGHYLVFVHRYRWGRKAPSDSPAYFRDWFLTGQRYGHHLVIFHDHLKEELQERVKTIYSKTEFVKVKSINDRILHDQRFSMTYNYLLDHPEINYLVMTDIRDTIFLNDPFRAMAAIGDYFFIDNDVPFYTRVRDVPWLKQMTQLCYDDPKLTRETLLLRGCFDNGFIGGTRHVMLTALSKMSHLLKKAYKGAVCDQVTANIVYHIDFYDRVYAGYPLTSGFMLDISGPTGVCIKHKPRVLHDYYENKYIRGILEQ